MLIKFLLVFVGGGLGSVCRYGISYLLVNTNYTFPLATFLANFISCIILGALVGLSLRNEISGAQQLIFMTGFCGGFSTFSTFTNETFQLLQNGEHLIAFANILLSILICLGCIYLGLRLTS